MQSLADIPSWMVTAWGINLVSAQIILSISVLFAFVLPILLLRKNRSGFNVEIVAALLAEIVCVGLGWLHYWVLIVTLVVVAIASALLGSKTIFGG